MTGSARELRDVDKVEVVVVMDNYADALLKDTDTVRRPPVAVEGRVSRDTLLAEHGLSMIVRAFTGSESHEVLLDAGYTPEGVPHNLDFLGISLHDTEAVVLSHGHMDHTGSLGSIAERFAGPVPLILHPDALISTRYLKTSEGRIHMPTPSPRDRLQELGYEVRENRGPLLTAGGTVLVSGEIPRMTPYEKGMPDAFLERGGVEEKDEILDDQCLILSLAGRGLVVVAGCSHAGIVNTVRYAVEQTGRDRVYAVMGGFHLGADPDGSLTGNTIEGLKAFSPEFLMPMHCTGWEAMHRIARAFPGEFALSGVGAKVMLTGAA